jgi:hypothetical protein
MIDVMKPARDSPSLLGQLSLDSGSSQGFCVLDCQPVVLLWASGARWK